MKNISERENYYASSVVKYVLGKKCLPQIKNLHILGMFSKLFNEGLRKML